MGSRNNEEEQKILNTLRDKAYEKISVWYGEQIPDFTEDGQEEGIMWTTERLAMMTKIITKMEDCHNVKAVNNDLDVPCPLWEAHKRREKENPCEKCCRIFCLNDESE